MFVISKNNHGKSEIELFERCGILLYWHWFFMLQFGLFLTFELFSLALGLKDKT